MSNAQFEVERTKEDLLRQELRGSQALLVSLIERGVMILAAVEVILYYIRQDVTAHLRELGRLNADELLPLSQWIIGTILLLIIAVIFARSTQRVAQHYSLYRLQLASMTPTFTGIAEDLAEAVPGQKPRQTRSAQHYAFYAFPLFDLAVWVVFYAAELGGGASRMVW